MLSVVPEMGDEWIVHLHASFGAQISRVLPDGKFWEPCKFSIDENSSMADSAECCC